MTPPSPFRDLLASDGVVEVCELRGRVGFMAYHGGSLEEMTDVVAHRAADACGASYYGVLQPPDLKWHIPSHHVAPEHSPTLQSFLDHVEVVITVHGYGRDGMWTTVLLGGQNRDLALHLAEHLTPHRPDYPLETRLEHIPVELRGLHDRNPVNLPPGKGVQIELPPRIRGRGTRWADWQGPGLVPHTQSLIDGLAAAVAAWEL